MEQQTLTCGDHKFLYVVSGYNKNICVLGETEQCPRARLSTYKSADYYNDFKYLFHGPIGTTNADLIKWEKAILDATRQFAPPETASECRYDFHEQGFLVSNIYKLIRETLPLDWIDVDVNMALKLKCDVCRSHGGNSSTKQLIISPIIEQSPVNPNDPQLIVEQKEPESLPKTPLELFVMRFLPGKSLREIQADLWNKLDVIYNDDSPYKGLIQWATGVGKTIACLMSITQSIDQCVRLKKKFRGIFIAPELSIFETMKGIDELKKYYGVVIITDFKTNIPKNKHVLFMASHQLMTQPKNWNALPKLDLFHYDEVHRCTGSGFFKCFNNATHIKPFMTLGTSATPFTADTNQCKKLKTLFPGTPLSICAINDAVSKKYIAQPRFGATLIKNTQSGKNTLDKFVKTVIPNLLKAKQASDGKCNKIIAFIATTHGNLNPTESIKYVAEQLMLHSTNSVIYSHTGVGKSDKEFVSKKPDGKVHILVTCRKYQTGADICDLDMTIVFKGNSMMFQTLIQIAGRALRLDYTGKVGWCCVVQVGDSNNNVDDIFKSIVMSIATYFKISDKKLTRNKLKNYVKLFFGSFTLDDKLLSVEETMEKIMSIIKPKKKTAADRALDPKNAVKLLIDVTAFILKNKRYLYGSKTLSKFESEKTNHMAQIWRKLTKYENTNKKCKLLSDAEFITQLNKFMKNKTVTKYLTPSHRNHTSTIQSLE